MTNSAHSGGSMTDRELLELAAKAAGIEWYGMAGDDNDSCAYFDIGPDEVVKWNPLRDDGDALRLAVKVGMNLALVLAGFSVAAAHFSEQGVPASEVVEPHNSDPCAATRRAIVRAAAEIGRQHD